MNADVTVRELMDREYVGVSESDELLDTVELLLREEADAAVVQRGGHHVGVLSERDVLSLLVEGPDPAEATVGDAMTESVPTISPEVSLEEAADEMSTRSDSRLIVTNGSEPLGLITEQDLLASRTYGGDAAQLEQEVSETTVAPAMETTTEGTSKTTETYEDQSICERCGTLSTDLTSFNGQLLCADCRDI